MQSHAVQRHVQIPCYISRSQAEDFAYRVLEHVTSTSGYSKGLAKLKLLSVHEQGCSHIVSTFIGCPMLLASSKLHSVRRTMCSLNHHASCKHSETCAVALQLWLCSWRGSRFSAMPPQRSRTEGRDKVFEAEFGAKPTEPTPKRLTPKSHPAFKPDCRGCRCCAPPMKSSSLNSTHGDMLEGRMAGDGDA